MLYIKAKEKVLFFYFTSSFYPIVRSKSIIWHEVYCRFLNAYNADIYNRRISIKQLKNHQPVSKLASRSLNTCFLLRYTFINTKSRSSLDQEYHALSMLDQISHPSHWIKSSQANRYARHMVSLIFFDTF